MSVITFGNILLPCDAVNLEKWSVVACDQFTSEPKYWEDLKEWIGDEPSTLSLICPECYLGDVEHRLPLITQSANEYAENILTKVVDCVIVKRTLESSVRTGLVCKIDLEEYSYLPGSTSKIRATEKTVTERIPPRLAVKRASRLDLPHVLCLIDDKKNVIANAKLGKKLYSFELSGNGGHIEGYEVENKNELTKELDELEKNMTEANKPFILVGDGNHSLASAKAYYEELKEAKDSRANNARYALVEIESIYDEGIQFEPIHRAIFSLDALDVIKCELSDGVPTQIFVEDKECIAYLPEDKVEAYNKVTKLLDKIAKEQNVVVDYIHGLKNLKEVCKNGGIGIAMPSIDKDTFFDLVAKHGVLPKKTFSMGHANEKRYYLESRDFGKKE